MTLAAIPIVAAPQSGGSTYRYCVVGGGHQLQASVFNDLAHRGNRNTLRWELPGNPSCLVFKDEGQGWGFIGESRTGDFTDDNIFPDLRRAL